MPAPRPAVVVAQTVRATSIRCQQTPNAKMNSVKLAPTRMESISHAASILPAAGMCASGKAACAASTITVIASPAVQATPAAEIRALPRGASAASTRVMNTLSPCRPSAQHRSYWLRPRGPSNALLAPQNLQGHAEDLFAQRLHHALPERPRVLWSFLHA